MNKYELSIIIPYYFNGRNCDILYKNLETYSKFPEEILNKTFFVLIDDGSPMNISGFEKYKSLHMIVIKIKNDIAWNHPFCRNLGVVLSRSEKFISVDVDHFFPYETFLSVIVDDNFSDKCVYTFNRKEYSTGKILKPNNGIFCMNRFYYLKYKGSDEIFTGSYGYVDPSFTKLHKIIGSEYKVREDLVYLDRETSITPEKYHNLSRDSSKNRKIYDVYTKHSGKFLSIDCQWEISYES